MSNIKDLLKNKSTIVIDVRSSWEYDEEHVPSAQNIPLEEITNNLETLKSFGAPIVCYCRSGNRSGMAVSILKQNGITDVYNGGGIDDLKFN